MNFAKWVHWSQDHRLLAGGMKKVQKAFRTILATLGLGCAFYMAAPLASASVAGTLLTGSTGTVTATLTSVIFNNDPAAIGGTVFGCPANAPACDSDVATHTSLSFAGCPSGTLGVAGCLSTGEGVDVNSPITAASVGQDNFLTFSNTPGLEFSLTGITQFTNADCTTLLVGESCTAYPGSAIQLELEPNNETQVSIFVSGKTSDSGNAGLATGNAYAGGFTQLLTDNLPNGMAPTPANIQAYFCGTNTNVTIGTCAAFEAGQPNTVFAITSSQSGSFTVASAVPEPSSMVMLLVGGALMGLATFRSRRSS
jgi:hypothetical protein